MLKRWISKIYVFYVKTYFKVFLSFKDTDNYIFVDIDNTLADTGAKINSKKSLNKIYQDLLDFPKVISLISLLQNDKKNTVIFLSARNPLYFLITKKWLSNRGFKSINLILVPSATDKLSVLECIPSDIKIFLYDDLSYNHENGEVKFYSEIISELETMKNVTYFDYEYLKKYQV